MNVIYDKKQMEVVTSDSQTTPGLSYDLIRNCACKGTVSVIGMNKITGDMITLERKLAVRRSTGLAVIVGNIVDVLPQQSDPSLSSASVEINQSGTAFVVSVTGVEGQTIDWLIYVDITVSQDNYSQGTKFLKKLFNLKF